MNRWSTWGARVKSPSPRSQSYLQHISGFLTKMGVSVQKFSEDRQPLPEPEEDELVPLGRQWYLNGDLQARARLFELAIDLVRDGQASRVSDACHLLIGEICEPSSEVAADLVALVRMARQSLLTEMG